MGLAELVTSNKYLARLIQSPEEEQFTSELFANYISLTAKKS